MLDVGPKAPDAPRLHVALWGQCDTISNTLQMKLGLPDDTLRLLGLKYLPEGYMVTFDISGELQAPKFEWGAAVRKFAVLSALQLSKLQQGVVADKGVNQAEMQGTAGGSIWGKVQGGLFGAANRWLGSATATFIEQVGCLTSVMLGDCEDMNAGV